MTCACGTTELHRIAHRRTSDGKRVELWSDGVVLLGNGKFCYSMSRKVGLEAGWLVMGEVALYTASELAALCKAAKASAGDKTTRLGPTSVARLRARMEVA